MGSLPLDDSLLPRGQGSPKGQEGKHMIRSLAQPWRIPAPRPPSMAHGTQVQRAHLAESPPSQSSQSSRPSCPEISMLWAFPESGQDIRLPDTEQTGIHRDRQRYGVAGPSRHKRGMTRRGKEWGRDGRGDHSTGPASFQESQPPPGSCFAHAKCMHEPEESSRALPGLRVEAETPAHPAPRSDLM